MAGFFILGSLAKQLQGLAAKTPGIPEGLSLSLRSAATSSQPFALKDYGYFSKGNAGIKVGQAFLLLLRLWVKNNGQKVSRYANQLVSAISVSTGVKRKNRIKIIGFVQP